MRLANTADLYRAAGEAEADGDFIAALRSTAEAVRVAPGDDYGRTKLAMTLSAMAVAHGRIRREWHLVERAYAACIQVARLLVFRGRHLLAIAACRAAFDLRADSDEATDILVDIHRQLADMAMPFGTGLTSGALPAITVPTSSGTSVLEVSDPREVFELALEYATSTEFGDVDEGRPINVPLLGGLSEDPFVALVQRMSLVRLPAEHPIIRQGEFEASVYVLLSGSVEVRRVEDGQTLRLATLRPGDIFGEMAFLSTEPRSASVDSVDPVEMLMITGDHVAQVALQFPEIASELQRVAGERLLLRAFGMSPFLAPLAERARHRLVRRMTFHMVPTGDTLIEQNADPTGLYLIVAGCVVISRQEYDESYDLASLGTGDILGEMALVSARQLTTARAVATQPTIVFHLDHVAFEALVEAHPEIRDYLEQLTEIRRRQQGDRGIEDASENATVFLVI